MDLGAFKKRLRRKRKGVRHQLAFLIAGLTGLSDEAKASLERLEGRAVAALGRGERLSVSAAVVIALVEMAKGAERAREFVDYGVGSGLRDSDEWVDWEEWDKAKTELDIALALMEGAVWGESREADRPA